MGIITTSFRTIELNTIRMHQHCNTIVSQRQTLYLPKAAALAKQNRYSHGMHLMTFIMIFITCTSMNRNNPNKLPAATRGLRSGLSRKWSVGMSLRCVRSHAAHVMHNWSTNSCPAPGIQFLTKIINFDDVRGVVLMGVATLW